MPEFSLDKDQAHAVETAGREQMFILTGGPGTGKTFTSQAILEHLGFDDYQIALCAPTGKAAKRLSEATKREATTVHRLLEYHPHLGWRRNEDCPLDQELVMIDEASMLDTALTLRLFRAIRPGTRVIMVGDKDQLPSVGAGNVLRDMIASGCVPTVNLTYIHRQSERSFIAVNAQRINAGKVPVYQAGQSDDYFHVNADRAEDAFNAIVNLVVNTHKTRGISLDDIQVLCPMREKALGVNAFNVALQERLNPKGEFNQECRGFRVRDKVIHIRNNYKLGVFNGETGVITDICGRGSKSEICVSYSDDENEVCYTGEHINDLALSYALTIHKSQGSEWPCVIMPVHSHNSFMLSRNLFYTGLTRAKRLAFVVCDSIGLQRAVRANQAAGRFTGLTHQLRRAFGMPTEEAA